MKAKKATYNKDGTIRKSGSGRRKGSNSFVKVSFSTLKEYIGEKTPIMVSRVWLENLGLNPDNSQNFSLDLTEESKSDKILFSLKDN
jgi:hypothetical protein